MVAPKQKSIFRIFTISILLLSTVIILSAESGKDFYLKGTFYQDWMGVKGDNTDMYNRLSSRFKLTFWNKPGDGWTADFDLRNRFVLNNKGGNQLIIYDAKIYFNSLKSKFFLSIGQMNLYDSAGIGELSGILGGYKPFKNISLGGYYGLEPDIYNSELDFKYTKFGAFVRYVGPGAKQFSLSYNHFFYDGKTERQYLYSNIFFPFKRLFILFGTAEYELADTITNEDRLARLFLNARFNISRKINITGNYSSGRGLDFHRYILEQGEDFTVQTAEIERYYYNESYGIRLSLKPVRNLRLSVSRRESERVDEGIKNHTTRFSFSVVDILKSGISLSANYNVNRGGNSESDSYYISSSKYFGKLNTSITFSNYFNAIYFTGEGLPEIIHIPDRKTISANLFYIFNRHLAFSMEYAYSFQEDYKENRIFARLIVRK